MKSNWNGLVKIDLIQHVRDGKVIWEDRDLRNLLHYEGQKYLLQAAFQNNGETIPNNYYFGLDSRATVAKSDTMISLVDEPNGGGYARVAVSSVSGFTFQQQPSGVWRAISSLLQFTSTGGGYGPVRNLFLTGLSGMSQVLIASNALSSAITLTSGDTINLRMSLQLEDAS
jgi:hypothetical protein